MQNATKLTSVLCRHEIDSVLVSKWANLPRSEQSKTREKAKSHPVLPSSVLWPKDPWWTEVLKMSRKEFESPLRDGSRTATFCLFFVLPTLFILYWGVLPSLLERIRWTACDQRFAFRSCSRGWFVMSDAAISFLTLWILFARIPFT